MILTWSNTQKITVSIFGSFSARRRVFLGKKINTSQDILSTVNLHDVKDMINTVVKVHILSTVVQTFEWNGLTLDLPSNDILIALMICFLKNFEFLQDMMVNRDQ